MRLFNGFAWPLALVAAAILAAPAIAQTPGDADAEDAPFTGLTAGVQAGVLEHHYALSLVVNGTSTPVSSTFRSYGAGGGPFVGYDFVGFGPRIRWGLEAGGVFGGRDNVARFPTAKLPLPRGEYRLSPRYGYRLTARGGVTFGRNLMLYGTAGFGGHRYRVTDTAGIQDADTPARGDSFIVGIGGEYRIARRIGVRIDFKHLDNQTNEWFVGIPIRF